MPVGPSAAPSQYPDAAAKIPAAVQTVRDYFNAFNHVIDTGDENEVVALFAPDCTKCIDDVTSFQNLLDGGHTLRGGHVHLAKIIRANVLGSRADSVEVVPRKIQATNSTVAGR